MKASLFDGDEDVWVGDLRRDWQTFNYNIHHIFLSKSL